MEQLLLPLLLMAVVAIPLVMGTRKQKRMAAQQQELQKSLHEGDRVMTTSGLYATVADTSGDTTVDLEIAPGVVTTWLRQAVREKVQPQVDDETSVEEITEPNEPPVVASAAETPAETPVEVSAEDTEVAAKDDEKKSGEPESTATVAPPLEHDAKK